MDLKVPIKISDELSDDIVDSTGLLDLASGEIHRIEYEDYDLEGRGLPADSEDYEFTVGTLSNNGLIGNPGNGYFAIENNAGAVITELDNNAGGTLISYYTALVNAGTIGTLSNNGRITGWTHAVSNTGTIGLLTNNGSIVANLCGGCGTGIGNASGGGIGVLTVLGLALLVGVLWRRERRKGRPDRAEAT